MKRWANLGLMLAFSVTTVKAQTLPPNFVYLNQVDPSILQDMRYASYHNFVGRPINGYDKATCIVTQPTAQALKAAQKKLVALGYSLKVYDCYRPEMAVNDFYSWSLNSSQIMKAEFYPRTSKHDLFSLGYIAAKSGHSRGSTVDLTLVPLYAVNQRAEYKIGQPLTACYAPIKQRFPDNSIDMGTGYDCLDLASNIHSKFIAQNAYQNRMMLRFVMQSNGFIPYDKEWWHFTLKNEPYPKQYFNFKVD